MEMKQRSLALSDFVSEKEAEIVENPYKFLNLSEDAPFKHVRMAYIKMAHKFHPDMVGSYDEKKREWAHRKMIMINRAYEEIKSRQNPKELGKVCGYDTKTTFNDKEGYDNQHIQLEAQVEITIFPNHFEYWVAGAYLEFDYGHQDWDPGWDHFGFRHQIPIKSLFVCIEIDKGQKVNRVLLEPFIDCFGLDEKQAKTLEDMLTKEAKTDEIMDTFGIPNERDITDSDSEDYKNKIRYSMKFRRQINQMLFLDIEPEIIDLFSPTWVNHRFEDGKLILEDQTQTIFSEADLALLSTLAYGPMLT